MSIDTRVKWTAGKPKLMLSQLPFGFDVDGYEDTILRNWFAKDPSQLPFGFDVDGYRTVQADKCQSFKVKSQLPFGFDVDGYPPHCVCNLLTAVLSQLPFGFDVDGYQPVWATLRSQQLRRSQLPFGFDVDGYSPRV